MKGTYKKNKNRNFKNKKNNRTKKNNKNNKNNKNKKYDKNKIDNNIKKTNIRYKNKSNRINKSRFRKNNDNIKFSDVYQNIHTINLNIDLLKYYKPSQLIKLLVPKSYYKLNSHQFVNYQYNGGIMSKYYLKRLTNENINDIETKILDFNLDDIDRDSIMRFNIENLYPRINDICERLKTYGSMKIFLMNHNLKYIYIGFKKENIDFNDMVEQIKSKSLTNNKALDIDTNIKTIVINKLNNVLSDIETVFMTYQKVNMINRDKSFFELVEHICFNISFGYLKQYGIPINLKYKNQFGQLKEVLIKNNKYIANYYPVIPLGKVDQLTMTNVGLYSISKPFATKEIIKLIQEKVHNINPKKTIKDMIITDATAGVGGDTIAFAEKFKYVNSVEIQEIHHNLIKHNCKIFGLENINHINDDYTKVYNKINQDIIFIDSPWGGSQYKTSKKSQLMMFGSSLTFNKFIKNILEINPKIILFVKCPANYSVQDLDTDLYFNDIKNKNFEINGVGNFILISLY
jgi:predicted RNA methylase